MARKLCRTTVASRGGRRFKWDAAKVALAMRLQVETTMIVSWIAERLRMGPPGHGWDSVEDQLRTKLPDDYKRFVQSFGTGTINEFLWILNPFSANQYVNLLVQIHIVLDAFQTSKNRVSTVFRGRRVPSPGRIIAFWNNR